jgi:hypothetical protein
LQNNGAAFFLQKNLRIVCEKTVGTRKYFSGTPISLAGARGMHRTPFRFWAVKGSRTTTPAMILSKMLRDIAFAAWRFLWKYLCHQ